MNLRPLSSSLPVLGYACLVAALFLFVKGYQFNTDDQAEHLPQVYQQLDPELYPNDYFVNASASIFTVRHYYEKLVLTVAETIGLEWGLFILTFLCIALMAFSFARIAEELFQDRWATLLAPILAMMVFYNFTVGGNHVMYGSFISSTAAKAIASFALLQFIRKKYILGGLVLGLASLFQPLVGLLLFLILTGRELLIRSSLKNVFSISLAFLAVAAWILIPVFERQFAVRPEYDRALFYEIMFRFRNHHHYLPSLFPATHYIKFAALVLIGSVSYFLLKPNDRSFFPGLVGFGILGMIAYAVGLEVLHIHPIGKVQWFKLTVWISAFSSIMLAGLLGQLLSGFFPLSKLRHWLLPVSVVGSIVLLLGITNSKFLPEKFQHRYMVGNRVHSDLEKMHFWIAEHTQRDVSVLVSPDNNAFSCQAKRSMPIHYQAIVHEPFFMLPWYEDYKEIYGVSIENLKGIDARQHAVELYATKNYRGTRKHIDLRLDNLGTCQFPEELGPVVHQQGMWVLTEFLPMVSE